MRSLATDVRHAWRALRHRPLFSALTIATLAVGLGATMAMFTVTNAVLVRPLPFPADHELVVLTERQAIRNLSGASFPAVDDWRAFPELASVGAHETSNLLFGRGDLGERVSGVSVSPGFFTTLGVAPALGRVMMPGEPLLDPDGKIVLGHQLWQRQFSGDASVIGRPVMIEGRQYTIVGVMPPDFAYPAKAEFWATLPPAMARVVGEPDLRFLEVVGRLASGATVDQLNARLAQWKQREATIDPTSDAWHASATSLRDEVVGSVRGPLLTVFAGVALLLLVACSNASALVLAHGRSTLRDLAVQSALGADRARLVRQLLVEGALLSAAGGLVAVAFASMTRNAIIALSANQIPRVADMHVDARVWLFALAAGAFTTVLVALGPALMITRGSHAALLQRGSRSTTSGGAGRRLFGPLVAVEFAMALVLAAAAGLLMASYAHLKQVDNGFQPASVLSAVIEIPLTKAWRPDPARRRLHDDLLTNIRAVPGVTAAGLVDRLPLSSVRGGTDAWPDGRSDATTLALLQVTSEGYFTAMGARLLAGRDFAPTDTDTAPAVAIVNDVAARRFWPDGTALGHHVTYQFMFGPQTVTVIGVVGAMRYNDVTSATRPEIYVTFRQSLNTPMTLVVKTARDPLALVPPIRAALGAADGTGTVTFSDVATLDARMTRVFARPRFYLVMVSAFAAAAFVLAALGIYGTMTFWIGERWKEFGIRVALGASRSVVVSLIVSRGLTFALAGIVCGLVAAAAARGIISHLLFEVSPGDPAVLAAATAALALAAVLAALLPARRVSRVDPVLTLKGD